MSRFAALARLAPAALLVLAAPLAAQTALHPARALGDAPRLSGATSGWDATYYDLALDLDMPGRRIAGTVLAAGDVVGAPLGTLRLDLLSLLTVSAVRDADTGAPLAFSHAADVLVIDLGAPRPAGARVAVEVDYAGPPAASGFGAFEFSTRSGVPVAWSLSEPYGARAWWPSKDHPSDKADSVRIAVTAPEGLRVGSNGLLTAETTSGGRTTTVWTVRYPITTYLVSIAVGPYDALTQTYTRPDSLAAAYGPMALPVLHYWYSPAGATPFPQGWAEVLDIFPVLEWWFGPYPFDAEKYGHAEFGWGGGMEHQTMSSMGGSSPLLVAHELAHQWYGDAVSPRTWPHLWLNEGFASYAELLYWEARPDRYPGRFRQALADDQASARTSAGTLLLQDTSSVNAMFAGNTVYAKGSAVLHMLRAALGDAAFRQTLQAYATDPATAYGSATTADLQRVAETVSGRSLDAFFRQWVTEGTGYPRYEIAWTHAPAASGHDVALTIRQTQTAAQSNVDAFVMPVVVEVETAAGTERFTVENTARVQTMTLRTTAPPTAVRLDPDGDLLRATSVAVSAEDAPSAPALWLEAGPNPAAGALTVRFGGAGEGPATLALLDALGRTVQRWEAVSAAAITLALDAHPAGAYTLVLDAAGRRAVRPLTLVR
jgi:aminopeptidase N